MTTQAFPIDLDSINPIFQTYEPSKIVEWAARTFEKGLVMSSSFGADSAVLLHMVTRIVPDLPVVLVDTGYLFTETYAFLEETRKRLNLNVKVYRTLNDPIEWLRTHDEPDPSLRNNVDACCGANKNEVFDRAMRELAPRAWLRGIRRDQSSTRKDRQIVEWSDRYNCYAISPLLNWRSWEIHAYLKQHDLPYHPLVEKGYLSIGCNPLTCTRPIMPGDDPRAGRWADQSKTECGLHIEP